MWTGIVRMNKKPLRPNSGVSDKDKPAALIRLFPFRHPRIGAGGLLFSLCFLLAGCTPRDTIVKAAPLPTFASDELLAPGVIHRGIPTGDSSGIDVIDEDLATSHARWSVQTHGVTLINGRVVGQSYTPREWLTRTHGLVGINGGYFGQYEDALGRKDFVGLLIQRGKVRHAAPPLTGQGSPTLPRGRYIRSTFGLTAGGQPSIAWAATRPGKPQAIDVYDSPMGKPRSAWRVAEAVGCGPMLIAGGSAVVTDSRERLVSPGLRPRTFAAYDRKNGRPRHLIVGTASASDFPGLAQWIAGYFLQYHKTRAEAAMCLDGGASTQMSYTLHGTLQSPRETGVTVPDALVLLPTR